MREPLYSLACEISHVSNYKTSITLRVQICQRHKVRHKNCRKYTKKLKRQGGFVVFFLTFAADYMLKRVFWIDYVESSICFVPRNDAKRQKVPRLASRSPESTNQQFND